MMVSMIAYHFITGMYADILIELGNSLITSLYRMSKLPMTHLLSNELQYLENYRKNGTANIIHRDEMHGAILRCQQGSVMR